LDILNVVWRIIRSNRVRVPELSMAIALVAMSAACAQRVPSQTYSHAFSFSSEVRMPRVLETDEETVLPLTVVNSGQRVWDPARVHLSYHWLWLVPRELLRRSRTLPYHEGIRTELAGAVSPGAGASVQGRLLAPSFPGLYWLQWDMVEEGVTWFAQVSPRQPRRLVIVLPSLATAVVFLPLLLALAGLGALRRSAVNTERSPWLQEMTADADVLWCAATFFAKPLILARQARLEPTATAYALIVIVALGLPLLGRILFPRRVRGIVLVACGTVGTLLVLADAIYYRFFGDVLSASAVLAARQTGQVWESIRSLITPGMLWFVLDLPFAVWLIVRLRATSRDAAPATGRSRAAVLLVALTAIGIAISVPILRAGALDQRFRDRAVMEQLGPLGYHVYDIWRYARARFFQPAMTPDEIAHVRAWFAERAPLRAGGGPYFGAAAARNLIVIQVESMQDFVVDYRVGGQDVMPTLRRWTEDGLRFTNVTDETNQGRTSDAELTALTSLLPLDRGAAAFEYSGNHYVGLPRVLAEHGYSTLSAVPFESGFWNRRVMHPSYGFDRSLFEPDFEMTEQIGWGLNDRDFLLQMIPQLEKLKRPFAAWLITLSLHHPFDDFPDAHKVLRLGSLERSPLGNYLHTMRFFDQAFADFKTALARAGLLDDTLLVVFGDHDAGFSQEAGLARTIGIGADDAAWELNDRVPFLVRLPRTVDGSTGVVSLPAGQTDFAPTLLALLGIDPAALPYVGRNLLARPGDPPVLRPHGGWIDGPHLFFDRGRSSRSCYALTKATFVDDSACRAADASAQRSRDVSRLVVMADLQQRLREALR
jgi:phosphoglycerol transferase MdoB-like AlkP superfamily enzyme